MQPRCSSIQGLQLLLLLLSLALCLSGCAPSLCELAKRGDLDDIRKRIQDGDDVNGGDCSFTPLQYAARGGHVEVAQILLDSGAEVNDGSRSGYSPLSLASREGHVELARLLIDAGADVNFASPSRGRHTALSLASREGHLELVELLLDRGADVNVQVDAYVKTGPQKMAVSPNGNTPLTLAIVNDHPDIVKILIDHGADCDMRVVYEDSRDAYGLFDAVIFTQDAHVSVGGQPVQLLPHLEGSASDVAVGNAEILRILAEGCAAD